MDFKEKARLMTEDILSAVNKKDDPMKELLVIYVAKRLEEAYTAGLINSKTPY